MINRKILVICLCLFSVEIRIWGNKIKVSSKPKILLQDVNISILWENEKCAFYEAIEKHIERLFRDIDKIKMTWGQLT